MTAPVPALGLADLALQVDAAAVVSVLTDGLSKAAIYVMIAAGLTLIFGLMGVLNFAHGSLTMLGAYLGGALMVVAVSTSTSGPVRLLLFFVVVVAVFALLSAFGAALEYSLVRPLYDRPPLYQILLTFGLTLVLDELARMVVQFYGLQPQSAWQEAIGTKPGFLSESAAYEVAGAKVSGLAFFEIALGVLVTAAVWAFLTRTRYGLYIRAGSEDSEMAEALGINIRQAFTVVFGVGVGVAGVAGVLLMWDTSWGASVPLGAETLLPAFVVVIIGGLGTFRGTVVAGVLVGMADALTTFVFNEGIIDFSGLPELTVFLMLVVMLILQPQGIAGVKEVGGH
jgi:branched-chain amino acid transport system permease protein